MAKKNKKTKHNSFVLTYATMFDPPEELHNQFERGLAKVKSEMGQEHAMLIGGEEIKSREKFEDRSPINMDWRLGTFQKGTASHAKRALTAARKA
nr:L-glutamate gamma-semialdehyde dehydrogenase [candidate division Zixibacteria bacterium]